VVGGASLEEGIVVGGASLEEGIVVGGASLEEGINGRRGNATGGASTPPPRTMVDTVPCAGGREPSDTVACAGGREPSECRWEILHSILGALDTKLCAVLLQPSGPSPPTPPYAGVCM